MGAPQARGERDRQRTGDVAVVDEVVLGDREALPRALGRRVEAALQMEDDGALLERKLDAYVFGRSIGVATPSGETWQKLPRCRPAAM